MTLACFVSTQHHLFLVKLPSNGRSKPFSDNFFGAATETVTGGRCGATSLGCFLTRCKKRSFAKVAPSRSMRAILVVMRLKEGWPRAKLWGKRLYLVFRSCQRGLMRLQRDMPGYRACFQGVPGLVQRSDTAT